MKEGDMSFDAGARRDYLRAHAAEYIDTAARCIRRQYPCYPFYTETGPGPYPSHREAHPAFYGSFDWHSCVEMHWVIARLLRMLPNEVNGEFARAMLNESFTEENLAKEKAFFTSEGNTWYERPYGWAWYLTLVHELETWDDQDARRWASVLAPLAQVFEENMTEWLPLMTYAQRSGLHSNTAFGMSLSLDYADLRKTQGKPAFRDAIQANAMRWYRDDTDYPVHYEPSGSDFLSAGLVEAEIMSRLLPPEELPGWLQRFLPGLANQQPKVLFEPVTVSS